MTGALPIRVLPQPDESVPSMLRRLSSTTGIPLRSLHDGPIDDLLRPPWASKSRSWRKRRSREENWENVAVTLGLPQDQLVREHCLGSNRVNWHTEVDAAPFHLRDPGDLECNRCGYTQIWAHLTLVTACTNCGQPLGAQRLGARTATSGRCESGGGASGAAASMQDQYLALVRASRRVSDERFKRLWRLFELVLCGLGTSFDLNLPDGPTVSTVRRPNTASPKAGFEPSWVAQLAEHIWPASQSDAETQAFIVQTLRAALPEASPTAAHRQSAEVGGLRQRLHEVLRCRGITPARIPDLVMSAHHFGSARCHLEGVAYATSLALRREAEMAFGGNRPESRPLMVPSEMWPSIHLLGLAEHMSVTPTGLALLDLEAEAIADDLGREPWRADRAALRPLRQVPRDVLRQAGTASDRTAGKVAAAWIWLEISRGAWSTGSHSRALRGRVQRFDDSLTPEGRLRLTEFARDFATAVESDVAADLARSVAVPAPRAIADDAS